VRKFPFRIFFIFLNSFRWLPEKGYGFLRPNAGGSDVFVHLRDLNDGIMSLEEGQTVEFNIKTNEKGVIAQNVTVRSEP
jgi:CspA family cold shock protein